VGADEPVVDGLLAGVLDVADDSGDSSVLGIGPSGRLGPDEHPRGLGSAAVAAVAFVLLCEDADLSRLLAEGEEREGGRDDGEHGKNAVAIAVISPDTFTDMAGSVLLRGGDKPKPGQRVTS
jgi:hypothetical protein